MNKIQEALKHRLEEHDVLFWYDPQEEFKSEFERMDLGETQKIAVEGNEFEVKYRIMSGAPNSKYLLYFNTVQPPAEENWLLDLQLCNYVFHTDQEALYAQELGLSIDFKDLIGNHLEFFKSKERKQRLTDLLKATDSYEDIRLKILSVVFKTSYTNLNVYVQAHANDYFGEEPKIDRQLERFNLKSFYWGKMEEVFGYVSEHPSIYDFLFKVFSDNFNPINTNFLSKETRILLSQWKDTLGYRAGFAAVSEKLSKDLSIEEKLNQASLDDIVDDDLFKLTDLRIIHELVGLVVEDSISKDRLQRIIKKRENKFWYEGYATFYECIGLGGDLLRFIQEKNNLQFDSFKQGTELYEKALYEIDFLYRKFILFYRRSYQNRILYPLAQKIERAYAYDYLLQINDSWQKVIDQLDTYPIYDRKSQYQFFRHYVQPFIEKRQRLFVIISDAFRYECGVELHQRISSLEKYESSIDVNWSALPSYTQLGMAALLPHDTIRIQENTDAVTINDMSASGMAGRANILNKLTNISASAIKAEEFMAMNSKTDGSVFVKQHDLIYIYHNRIDKTGDDKTTEDKIFDAAEEEIAHIIDIVKKIANMNGTHVLVTADHGFIYQQSDLEDKDYISLQSKGQVWKENRRFVLGVGMTEDKACKSFLGKQLGIDTDMQVLIPKSINRLRIKGAGSRFVHGGATLQELMIPVVKITRKRQVTTKMVDIDIIKSGDKITTNFLLVSFIQSELISDKVLSRHIAAGIYAEDGTLLSDTFKYHFDIEEGSERQREVKHTFQLMAIAAQNYKNQQVALVLKEPINGTDSWRKYKEYKYTLALSFINDFDDFS